MNLEKCRWLDLEKTFNAFMVGCPRCGARPKTSCLHMNTKPRIRIRTLHMQRTRLAKKMYQDAAENARLCVIGVDVA